MKTLSHKRLGELRGALEKRRDTLIAEISAGSRPEPAETARNPRDEGDDATESAYRDLRASETERDRAELQAVERALERIAAGDYGACETCSRDIEYERLLAQPSASRCVDCQRRHEHIHGRLRAASL